MKVINTYIIISCILVLSQTAKGQSFENNLSIRYNVSAVDGVGETPGRDIMITRLFSESVGFRLGYSQGMKSTDWRKTLLVARPNLLGEFISLENTADNISTEYFQYHSFNLGLYFISNAYGKSNISLYAGGRYFARHKMFIQSVGPTIESIDEKNIYKKGLGYEFELSYNYHPIDRMSISLGVNYVSNLGLFGASLGVGFSF